MTLLILLAVAVGILLAVIFVFTAGSDSVSTEEAKHVYSYTRNNFFMTKAEHEFYDTLGQAVGDRYRIFAQVHLPTLVDHKIKGQDWRAALAHINRKSVDFVLCDKEYLSPKLAIELDDLSHERPDRQERDREVERILQQAGVPLLRIENKTGYLQSELIEQIRVHALK